VGKVKFVFTVMDVYIVTWILFSFIIGSFLNVCIARFPENLSVVWPASRCPKCKTAIPWYCNIPVASYLALGGKCKFCKKKIAIRYLIVELLTPVLFTLIIWKASNWHYWVYDAYLMAALIIATFVDLEHWIIPDKVTLVGIPIGLLGALLLPNEVFLDHLFCFST